MHVVEYARFFNLLLFLAARERSWKVSWRKTRVEIDDKDGISRGWGRRGGGKEAVKIASAKFIYNLYERVNAGGERARFCNKVFELCQGSDGLLQGRL